MGSRGQSASKRLAKIDRASKKYNDLQERSDKIYPVGSRFYDRDTGQEVPREDVEKLSADLSEARERFEALRDAEIERESRAAERARERAEKRQATRDRQAGDIPAAFRVTFPDGRTQVYAQGHNGLVTDERGLPRDVQGMKYQDLYNRMRENQANSGVKYEPISSNDLQAMLERYREERRNAPDYEMGIGTPWGNKDNRRAARASRLAGRVARRR